MPSIGQVLSLYVLVLNKNSLFKRGGEGLCLGTSERQHCSPGYITAPLWWGEWSLLIFFENRSYDFPGHLPSLHHYNITSPHSWDTAFISASTFLKNSNHPFS